MKSITAILLFVFLTSLAYGNHRLFNASHTGVSLEHPINHHSTEEHSTSVLEGTWYSCVVSATVEVSVPGFGAIQVTITVHEATCELAVKELKNGIKAVLLK